MRRGPELKRRTFFLFNDVLIKGVAEGADKAGGPVAYRGMMLLDQDAVVRRGTLLLGQSRKAGGEHVYTAAAAAAAVCPSCQSGAPGQYCRCPAGHAAPFGRHHVRR